MLNQEPLPTWIYLFEEVRKIEEYDDLTHDFNSLMIKVKTTGEITEDDNTKFYEIIKNQWKRVLIDKYNELENSISQRKTQGENFSKDIKALRKIRKGTETDLELDVYPELFQDLKEIREDIDAKISIEKYQRQQSLKILIFGFILGVAGSLMVGKILSLI